MQTNLYISDLHINSTVALINPTAVLDDGGGYKPSRLQRWLFNECWLPMLDTVEKETMGDLYVHVCGDLADLDTKGRSTQVITRNPATVIDWSHDLLNPLAQRATGLSFLRGTAAHTGSSSNIEESVAGMFDNTMKNPETGKNSWWWMLWRSESVTIDQAHHPRMGAGGRPFNRFAGIDRLASDTVFTYANDLHMEPPALAIRGHLHDYKDSMDHFATRAVILPSWSGLTEFNHRHGITLMSRVGAFIVWCDGRHMDAMPILYEPQKPVFYSPGIYAQLKGKEPTDADND